MKSLIITIILLLTGITKVYSQLLPPTKSTERDTLQFMEMFEQNKKMYIGESLDTIIKRFQEYKVPVRFYAFGTTSPWIDLKAEIYVNEVLISYIDNEAIGIGEDFWILIIELEPPYMNYKLIKPMILRTEDSNWPIEPTLNALGEKWIIKNIIFHNLAIDI